jgi:hypothetical protein
MREQERQMSNGNAAPSGRKCPIDANGETAIMFLNCKFNHLNTPHLTIITCVSLQSPPYIYIDVDQFKTSLTECKIGHIATINCSKWSICCSRWGRRAKSEFLCNWEFAQLELLPDARINRAAKNAAQLVRPFLPPSFTTAIQSSRFGGSACVVRGGRSKVRPNFSLQRRRLPRGEFHEGKFIKGRVNT